MSPGGASAVVVDTMVVSALVNAHRNRAPAASFRQQIADRPIVVSFATVTEMRYGALKRAGLSFVAVASNVISLDWWWCNRTTC